MSSVTSTIERNTVFPIQTMIGLFNAMDTSQHLACHGEFIRWCHFADNNDVNPMDKDTVFDTVFLPGFVQPTRLQFVSHDGWEFENLERWVSDLCGDRYSQEYVSRMNFEDDQKDGYTFEITDNMTGQMIIVDFYIGDHTLYFYNNVYVGDHALNFYDGDGIHDDSRENSEMLFEFEEDDNQFEEDDQLEMPTLTRHIAGG